MKKSIKIPKFIIKYNRFLDPIFISYIQSDPKWKNWIVPSREIVLKRAQNYKKEWAKYEEKIIRNLCSITGLKFNRNVIDVYIVSGNPRQFSNPIIIKSGFPPDEFVDVLTHELIHKLFQDNIDIFPVKILTEMFPKESQTTKNHIFTHAILKYIYLDVLKDKKRLEKNIIKSKNHGTNDYMRAWKIVERTGYKKLIKELKDKIKKHPSPLN